MNKIINGDSLKVLKKLEDESVDLICTDPPYGYSFMGKDWDKVVPSVEIWKECLRVLKPGGFCFVMSAPRIDVQSRMGTKLEDAGFQTNFSPIYWTYATGFPKATNVGKMVDKKLGKKRKVVGKYKHPRSIEKGVEDKNWGEKSMSNTLEGYITQGDDKRTLEERLQITEPFSDEAKQLDGSYVGYQPKPAVEVILVCMKPIEEKSYIEQAMKNGKGITWLDDCRIPYENKDDKSESQNKQSDDRGGFHGENTGVYSSGEQIGYNKPDGRFAANLIVQDDVLNDGKNRKGGTSNGDAKVGTKTDKAVTPLNRGTLISRNDEGSFSRFYDLDAWWKSQIHKLPESVQKTFPFMVVAKASKSEKNEGLDDNFEEKLQANANYRPSHLEEEANSGSNGKPHGRYAKTKNNHPTVKPIELMSYLITLGSRDNDVVVDPFVGSGTTCVAAKLLNRQYIGIEKEEDYAIIAKARIKNMESKENNKASQFFEL